MHCTDDNYLLFITETRCVQLYINPYIFMLLHIYFKTFTV